MPARCSTVLYVVGGTSDSVVGVREIVVVGLVLSSWVCHPSAVVAGHLETYCNAAVSLSVVSSAFQQLC